MATSLCHHSPGMVRQAQPEKLPLQPQQQLSMHPAPKEALCPFFLAVYRLPPVLRQAVLRAGASANFSSQGTCWPPPRHRRGTVCRTAPAAHPVVAHRLLWRLHLLDDKRDMHDHASRRAPTSSLRMAAIRHCRLLLQHLGSPWMVSKCACLHNFHFSQQGASPCLGTSCSKTSAPAACAGMT